MVTQETLQTKTLKPSVVNLSLLPSMENSVGDIRFVISLFAYYEWNGDAWIESEIQPVLPSFSGGI